MAGNEKCWLPCHERAFASREDSPGIVPGGKLPSRKMLVLDDSTPIRSRTQEENSEYFDFADFPCESHKSTYADLGYLSQFTLKTTASAPSRRAATFFCRFYGFCMSYRTGFRPVVAFGRRGAAQSYWDSI